MARFKKSRWQCSRNIGGKDQKYRWQSLKNPDGKVREIQMVSFLKYRWQGGKNQEIQMVRS